MAAENGNVEQALSYFRKSVELQGQAVSLEPGNSTARRNLMIVWSNLGDTALGPLGQASYTGSGGPAVDIDPKRRREALEAFGKAAEQAEWIYQRDPGNDTVKYDYAICLGRRAPAYPPGDREAIAVLEKSLELLRQLEPNHPSRSLRFVLEFRGSLAERLRQAGLFERAVAEWNQVESIANRVIATDPESYYPRRQVIPVYENWATELARRKDKAGALEIARRAERMAGEVAEREAQYARAPGWPPRVRAWKADLYELLGDPQSARIARQESVEMWRRVATRSDLPADVLDEARKAIESR